MKQRIIHIFAVCFALCLLVGCSCSNKSKVIPRGKMAHIYAEMLVVDQWLLEHSKYRTQADTSLVYEPIFQKYGYTTEDYRASLEHYMNDPERYSRILRETVEILDEQIGELKGIKAAEDRLKSIVPYKMDPARLYYGRSKDRLWNFRDSVSVALDSLVAVYELGFHELSDTVFDGPKIIVKVDTLQVKDSLQVKQPIAAEDTTTVEKPEPKEDKPEPIKELIPIKEEATKEQASPNPLKGKPIKPTNMLTKEPQRILSTTLDSLKRK